MATVSDPVAWDLAQRVAVQVARTKPEIDDRTRRSLEADFDEFTSRAEELVSKVTGLAPVGTGRARVTDRAGWVAANLNSFRRLLRPLTDRIEAAELPEALAPLSRNAAAVQIGAVLGWMSGRVLGQYDVLIAEDEELDQQDLVYFVGPNIVSLERRHGFPPREFRLWIAIHEMTHRAQFTGVPWLRTHFLSLVERGLSAASLDPHQVVLAFRRAANEIRAGRNPLAENGIVGVVASDEQLAMLREIQALMSVLEGHGDVTMTRASMGVVPGAERFARVLSARRNEARGASRLIQQLVGVDAKLRQYAEGERFIEALEVAGGPDLVRRLFEGPEMFPSIAEVRQPRLWIERVGATGQTAKTRRLEAPSSS